MLLDLVATKFKITGGEIRQARRPISPMMTTKFIGVFIAVSPPGRRLSQTLSDIQIQYLNLPELTPDILITLYPNRHRTRKRRCFLRGSIGADATRKPMSLCSLRTALQYID
jgi:hypothetical protein